MMARWRSRREDAEAGSAAAEPAQVPAGDQEPAKRRYQVEYLDQHDRRDRRWVVARSEDEALRMVRHSVCVTDSTALWAADLGHDGPLARILWPMGALGAAITARAWGDVEFHYNQVYMVLTDALREEAEELEVQE